MSSSLQALHLIFVAAAIVMIGGCGLATDRLIKVDFSDGCTMQVPDSTTEQVARTVNDRIEHVAVSLNCTGHVIQKFDLDLFVIDGPRQTNLAKTFRKCTSGVVTLPLIDYAYPATLIAALVMRSECQTQDNVVRVLRQQLAGTGARLSKSTKRFAPWRDIAPEVLIRTSWENAGNAPRGIAFSVIGRGSDRKVSCVVLASGKSAFNSSVMPVTWIDAIRDCVKDFQSENENG